MAERFTPKDIQRGDWIRFTNRHGVSQIAEVLGYYPSSEPMLDIGGGVVDLAAVTEVRKKPATEHTHDRNGPKIRIVDESGRVPQIVRAPTCSVCGVPQVFD